MVQENTSCCEFVCGIKDDQCELLSKKMNSSSSCVTHECIDEEKERELKRQELIQRVREKRKNEVCVDAIEHLYYLIPNSKRSKIQRRPRYKLCTSTFLKKKNVVRKENEFSDQTVQDSEVPRIPKIEPFLKKKKRVCKENEFSDQTVQDSEVSRIPKIEPFLKKKNVVCMENEFSDQTVQDSEVPRIPKIEPFLKIRKENEFSDQTVQDSEVPRIPKIEPFLENEFSDQTVQDFEVPRIPKIEPFLKIRKENEFRDQTVQDSEVPRIPKIEPFLKSAKIKKMVHTNSVLPEELKNKIQELGVSISEVSLVIEKQLYSTDLSDKHMRLSIPVKQVVNPDKFLNAHEKEILDTRDSCNKMSKIKFNLIEPSLEVCNIHLAKWSMNSSSSYVLLNDWMSVHQRNGLKVNMMVQLWFFRKDENRWLALVVVPDDACCCS